LIGNIIDSHLQDISYGQTNAIPQGSSLMDLIAEMILGYADLELSKQIKRLTNFKIIRYRDDYRIFTNNPQTAEQIVKHITEILVDLGLCLNGQKTLFSSNVIESSIKPDKLFWLKSKRSNKSFQEHLFLSHCLSKYFPNSGTLIKALNSFFERIKNIDDTYSNIRVLVSILIDIAYKNPRTYPIASAILSKFLALCNTEEIGYLTNLTMKKFDKIPNTGHLQIWLQRALLKSDTTINFEEKLCKKIDNPNLEVWNCEWLNPNLRNIINNTSFIDAGIIEEMSDTIDSSEVQLFETRNNYTY